MTIQTTNEVQADAGKLKSSKAHQKVKLLPPLKLPLTILMQQF